MGACNSSNSNHHSKTANTTQYSNIKTHNTVAEKPEPPHVVDKISPYTKYDDINKYYTLGSHKGSGSFGIVREAIENISQKKFAVKTVWKAQFVDKKKFIQQEIEILMLVEHENIIKCYQVYEDTTSIHFVFDLIEGGELFDYLINSPGRVIPENRAVDFFNQILDALQYLHEKKIVHRDIKPENFLVYHSGNKIKLKLIDFGFAAKLNNNEKLNDKIGSLQYIAPEMFKDEEYDTKVDMWSSGVVLYNLLTGKQPFFGKGDNEIVNNIVNNEVKYSDQHFKNINTKTLCANLLNKNPEERFSANDAKASMWIQNFINIDELPTMQGAKFAPKEENIKNILNMLNQQTNIKTDVWNILLTYMSIDHITKLKENLIEISESGDIHEGQIGGKNSVTFETLLQTIIERFNFDSEMVDKLNGNILFIF